MFDMQFVMSSIMSVQNWKKTKSNVRYTFVDFGYISYYSHDLLVV